MQITEKQARNLDHRRRTRTMKKAILQFLGPPASDDEKKRICAAFIIAARQLRADERLCPIYDYGPVSIPSQRVFTDWHEAIIDEIEQYVCTPDYEPSTKWPSVPAIPIDERQLAAILKAQAVGRETTYAMMSVVFDMAHDFFTAEAASALIRSMKEALSLN